jgi:hypothetical protein
MRRLGVPHAGFQNAYDVTKRLVRVDASGVSTGC